MSGFPWQVDSGPPVVSHLASGVEPGPISMLPHVMKLNIVASPPNAEMFEVGDPSPTSAKAVNSVGLEESGLLVRPMPHILQIAGPCAGARSRDRAIPRTARGEREITSRSYDRGNIAGDERSTPTAEGPGGANGVRHAIV